MSTSVFKSDGHLRRQLLAGLWGLLSAGIIQPSANAEEGDPLAEIQADERSPTERGPTNQGSNEPETSQRSELADFSGPSLDGSGNNSLEPSRGSSGAAERCVRKPAVSRLSWNGCHSSGAGK